MKTTKTKKEAAAPASVRPSASKTGTPVSGKAEAQQREMAKHNANRELPTHKVLEFLKAQLPQQYALAEIVGRWIWLEASGHGAAKTLWILGFHWNERRGVWQHPCGVFGPFGVHSGEPRSKYGSRFATTSNPA